MVSGIPNPEPKVSGIPNLDLSIPESYQKSGIPVSIPEVLVNFLLAQTLVFHEDDQFPSLALVLFNLPIHEPL